MQLAKVVSRSIILGMTVILASANTPSPSVTSESKDEESNSSITAIAEEPNLEVSVFPNRLSQREFRPKMIPLSTFENVEIVYGSNSTTETEVDEAVDEDPLCDDNDSGYDSASLSYQSGITDADWSVIPLEPSLVECVIEQSELNDVDPCVVIALMQSESGFQTDVSSCVGCYGLMQLHPAYYPEDLVNPYKNIEYGVQTIGNNLKTTSGSYVYALSMYANGHIGTDFTYQYDVMTRAEEWREILQEANIL